MMTATRADTMMNIFLLLAVAQSKYSQGKFKLARDHHAGEFFRACNNVERINKMGGKPMDPWFKLIDTVQDKTSLLHVVVELNKAGMDHLFSWYIDTDSHDNSQSAFFLTQSDPSLPDKTYYTENTDEMKEHRAKMLDRVGVFFKMVGREKWQEEAKLVMQYETAMANILEDRTDSYKAHAQKTTWAEMQTLVPSWNWNGWLTQLATCTTPFNGVPKLCTGDHEAVKLVGTPEGKTLFIRNKQYFEKLDAFINSQSLDTIKAEMRWKIIKDAASSLSEEYQDTLLDWYKDLYGVQEKSARPRKCYYSTTSSVGWASAKLYSEKLFKQGNMAAARDMLENIRYQFNMSIPHATWMSEESRSAAQYKLAQMFFEVGIPMDKAGKVYIKHICVCYTQL
jgi:putative endopeptidase